MEKKRHILSCPGRQVGERGREREREKKGEKWSKKIKKRRKVLCFYTGLALVQLAREDSRRRLANTKINKVMRKILM